MALINKLTFADFCAAMSGGRALMAMKFSMTRSLERRLATDRRKGSEGAYLTASTNLSTCF